MLKQSKKIRDVIEISYNDTFIILAGIAQLVERLLAKQKVAGSNPVSRSIFNKQGGIMRYLLVLTLFFANTAFSEIYKDYEPSEEHIQLTVIAVESNYLDDYLVNLNKTWVRDMEVMKELGYIVDYGVYTSDNANSPNVWLTITYENMAAMQPNEEQYNTVRDIVAERYSETQDELLTISKGYEEIRKMVDNQIINRVVFK